VCACCCVLDGSSTGKGRETTNMLRRNGTKTGSRNLDEPLFSPAEEQVKVRVSHTTENEFPGCV
jgi:hypothetical protein